MHPVETYLTHLVRIHSTGGAVADGSFFLCEKRESAMTSSENVNIIPEDSASQKTAEGRKHATAKRKRQEHVDAVLQSSSRMKIVVAGPGTGKTHLFKEVLRGKTNSLTLTFVNALVEDLSLDLFGISEVKTLHGFARSVLSKAKKPEKSIKVFPKLAKVIAEDATILLGKTVDFDNLFHNREDGSTDLDFYKKRKDYYEHYGFSDMVFGVVKYFEKDETKIPTFGQVVVDEFQDFNRLEVSLIDLLAKKSPVLLAGDDDQALYESLKSATPKYIRQRYTEKGVGYAAFCLPYCSRSTRVIVEATNDIIAGARRDGHLGDRIDKPFRYFDHEEKDKESDNNPHLIYRRLFSNQIPPFIQQSIEDIAREVKEKFTVLIISPTTLRTRHEIT
jgi:superfamily I DNA/RNA helicase